MQGSYQSHTPRRSSPYPELCLRQPKLLARYHSTDMADSSECRLVTRWLLPRYTAIKPATAKPTLVARIVHILTFIAFPLFDRQSPQPQKTSSLAKRWMARLLNESPLEIGSIH